MLNLKYGDMKFNEAISNIEKQLYSNIRYGLSGARINMGEALIVIDLSLAQYSPSNGGAEIDISIYGEPHDEDMLYDALRYNIERMCKKLWSAQEKLEDSLLHAS